MQEVIDRLARHRQTQPDLRLYALADGLQYRTARDVPLRSGPGIRALFEGTRDAALAHAGPWLIDVERADAALVSDIARLEQEMPSVTWLITALDLEELAARLRLKLDVELSDGSEALLRFWDPRVLARLSKTFDDAQSIEFFSHIHEWHLLHEGRRAWIGRRHAGAD